MRRFQRIVNRKLQRDGDAVTSTVTFCEIWQEIVQGLVSTVEL